jgi:hypothetical protein
MAQPPRSLIVVRRGATDVFERLRAELAGKRNAPEVIWDRRVRDRRVIIRDVAIERRRGERRAPLDATQWATRGYIVVRSRPPAREAVRQRGGGKSRPAN